ncbi:PQQ-dependent sugar dehydrogenase [Streptomyces zagrosensis]|uniref:Glucose/arabinose dehydrogenase n=1 Tax=Streptomyces zagrosensis TaxID=1042984 RepID=A0A7W9V2B5_9ACTN|nr:PQQ-dependent sugar dehydrogenase [Streptomyces zagrosensis]MBB5939782.1 glucose/arabinose dehydrogenase [Streptomyces zagrosensis]
MARVPRTSRQARRRTLLALTATTALTAGLLTATAATGNAATATHRAAGPGHAATAASGHIPYSAIQGADSPAALGAPAGTLPKLAESERNASHSANAPGPAGAIDLRARALRGGHHGRSVPSAIRTVSGGWSVPWGLSWLPNGSALLTERETFKVFRLSRAGKRVEAGTVPNVVTTNGEGGLLGVAVSPNWNRDHHIFLMHSAQNDNRIVRMTYDGSRLGNYTVLVSGIKKHRFHNGGRLQFGPDKLLYATTGDAFESGLAQDKASLNGKILRMTPEGKPAPGNPYESLVYSIGHRNPQGLTWDAQGRLWEAEFGNNAYDELNLIKPGQNYGWPVCEGQCSTPGMTNPERQWAVSEASPSGIAYADGALYLAAQRGQRLWRVPVDSSGAGTPEAYYTGAYGRLRTVEKVPGTNALWLTTTNADLGGGQPNGSDKVFQVTLR